MANVAGLGGLRKLWDTAGDQVMEEVKKGVNVLNKIHRSSGAMELDVQSKFAAAGTAKIDRHGELDFKGTVKADPPIDLPVEVGVSGGSEREFDAANEFEMEVLYSVRCRLRGPGSAPAFSGTIDETEPKKKRLFRP